MLLPNIYVEDRGSAINSPAVLSEKLRKQECLN